MQYSKEVRGKLIERALGGGSTQDGLTQELRRKDKSLAETTALLEKYRKRLPFWGADD